MMFSNVLKKIRQGRKFEEAMSVYHLFKQKEGSEHIATPLSIHAVRMLAEESKNILEIGSGIGTLSYVILAHSRAAVTMYEDNAFCILQLKKNLYQFDGRYTLLSSYVHMPSTQDFDLVIVDGGNGQQHDGGYKQFIRDLFSVIRPKIVYIEGVRRPQRRMIRDALRGRIALKIKKIPYYKEHKGGTLYECYHAPRIVEELQYRWNELREHPRLENFFTKIKPPKVGYNKSRSSLPIENK